MRPSHRTLPIGFVARQASRFIRDISRQASNTRLLIAVYVTIAHLGRLLMRETGRDRQDQRFALLVTEATENAEQLVGLKAVLLECGAGRCCGRLAQRRVVQVCAGPRTFEPSA